MSESSQVVAASLYASSSAQTSSTGGGVDETALHHQPLERMVALQERGVWLVGMVATEALNEAG